MSTYGMQVDAELQSFRHDVTSLLLRKVGKPDFSDDGILSRYITADMHTDRHLHKDRSYLCIHTGTCTVTDCINSNLCRPFLCVLVISDAAVMLAVCCT